MSATIDSIDTLVHDEPGLVGVADAPAVELAAAVATSPVRRRGAFAGVWRTTTGKFALGVLGLIVLLAIFGPLLAPYDPNFQNTQKVLAGPSAQHLLGTDYVGRDVFSRLLAGSTLSVVTAIEAVGIAFVVGVIPGLLSLLPRATVRVGHVAADGQPAGPAADDLRHRPRRAARQRAPPGDVRRRDPAGAGLLPPDPGGRPRLHRRPVRHGGRADGRLAAVGAHQARVAQDPARHRGDDGQRHVAQPAHRRQPHVPRHRRRPAQPDVGRHARHRPGLPPPAPVRAAVPVAARDGRRSGR